MPRVVGLDLSLTDSGIVRSDGFCKNIGKDGVTKLPVWERSDAIDSLAGTIVTWCLFPNLPDGPIFNPQLVVAELPNMGQSYGGQLERAGLFWSVVQLLCELGVPVAAPTPPQRLTYVLGKGAGAKGAVIEAVTRLWPDYRTGGNDNIADALVYMAMGMDWLGHPLTSMPKPNRAVLDKIDKAGGWPVVRGVPS